MKDVLCSSLRINCHAVGKAKRSLPFSVSASGSFRQSVHETIVPSGPGPITTLRGQFRGKFSQPAYSS